MKSNYFCFGEGDSESIHRAAPNPGVLVHGFTGTHFRNILSLSGFAARKHDRKQVKIVSGLLS